MSDEKEGTDDLLCPQGSVKGKHLFYLSTQALIGFFRTEEYPVLDRLPSRYNPLHTFELAKGDHKHYQQQYGDMYFLRLAKLKPAVEEIAAKAWQDFQVRAGAAAKGFLNLRKGCGGKILLQLWS